MPPKKRISVNRKNHIPILLPGSSTPPSSATGVPGCGSTAGLSTGASFRFEVKGTVRMSLAREDRGPVEVVGGRGRRDLPFQGPPSPRILRRPRPAPQGPDEVTEDDDQSGEQDPRADRGDDVERPELRRIIEVAPGHAFISQDEHAEIEELETDEQEEPSELGAPLAVHP